MRCRAWRGAQPLWHEGQTPQLVLAPSAELPVKVTHARYFTRLICSFLHEVLAALALCLLVQTLCAMLKKYSFDFTFISLRLSNEVITCNPYEKAINQYYWYVYMLGEHQVFISHSIPVCIFRECLAQGQAEKKITSYNTSTEVQFCYTELYS